jgi:hypothetical protein
MVWVILAISLLGLSAEAQQSVPTAVQPQVSPAGAQRNGANPGRTTQSSLTNADVVRLVKAGVADSTIISSIQSSPTKFDLSPDALIALHNAGVSQAVLQVMMADGSARQNGGNAGAGAASRIKAGTRINARVKLSAPKTGPKVTNAAASQTHAVIIAVLDKQRQAANMEAAQMVRTPTRTSVGTVARPAPVLAGPSHPMMATGTASPGAGSTGTASPGMLGAGQPQASSGNIPASITHVQPMQNLALPCAKDPSMRIFNVSGSGSPATFTTDPKYNFYTITGCSFGDPGPNSKVYVYYQSSFHQDFQVQQWSDNGIKLNLDPALTGVLDQDNLTLVVQRNDGKQASKGGFKFYAARATTRLALIPRNSFSLDQFSLNNKTYVPSSLYTSPSSPKVIPNIGGWTSEVQWTSTDPSWEKLDPGEDVYQFKHLQPGFAPDSAQMTWVNLDCGDYQFVNLGGNFDLKWVGDDLHAQWQAQYCKPVNCGGTFQSDCFAGPPESNYAVDVWVTGPRGVDPWTGKPN